MNKILNIMGLFLVFLSIFSIPCHAAEQKGSLELDCIFEELVFDGDEYAVTKIADLDNGKIRMLPEYKAFDCNWNILISSQVHDRAEKIGEYVAENGYFGDRGITKNGGKVIFENMDTGLYLVTRTYTENTEYIVDPFLVSIPQVVDGEVIYRVVVEPKFSEVPDEESSGVEKPSEPESSEPSEQQDSEPFFTGDKRSWQSLIYILIGAFAVITGILLSDRKLKGNKE